MKEVVAGIDIGGTFTKFGIADVVALFSPEAIFLLGGLSKAAVLGAAGLIWNELP